MKVTPLPKRHKIDVKQANNNNHNYLENVTNLVKMWMSIAVIGEATMSLMSKLWWYILHVKLLETFASRHECIRLRLATGTKLFGATSSGCGLGLIKMLLGQQHAKGWWLGSLWPKEKQSALKMKLALLTTNKVIAVMRHGGVWLRTMSRMKDILTNTIQHKCLFWAISQMWK